MSKPTPGTLLREARQKPSPKHPRGFSQVELAKILGVSQTTISHWESDQQRPLGPHEEALELVLKLERSTWRSPEEKVLLRRLHRKSKTSTTTRA